VHKFDSALTVFSASSNNSSRITLRVSKLFALCAVVLCMLCLGSRALSQTCTPLTSCPAGDNCGTIPDGCGGALSCGTCNAPQTCGAGGTANVCAAPTTCTISGTTWPAGQPNPSNACQVCIPSASTTSWSNASNGTSCSDGNACTQADSCQNGACIGYPVTCTALDQCHTAGTCDSSTGQCSNPTAPDGTSCNNGNSCTQNDVCSAGVCNGGNPVVCTASDADHCAGTCNPSNGVCSNPIWTDPACGSFFVNGGFETGTAGSAPANPWTVTTYLSPNGFTAQTPQTIAGLNLASGGTALTVIENSASGPLTQIDPDLGSSVSLRWPRYGNQMVSVNQQTASTVAAKNVNMLSQSVNVTSNDVDPVDNQVHLRFTFAPILQAAGHPTNEQPYYLILVTDETQGKTLYEDFAYVGQSGIPWQTFNTESNGPIDYTDWQLVDVASQAAGFSVGDQIQLQIVAAGDQPGGFYGKVWVDGVGRGIEGITVEGSAPPSSNPGANFSYTLAYQNGASTSESDVVVTFVTPPNTTYQNSYTPGLSCTTPAVGTAGTVICNVGGLPSGASGSFTVTVLPTGAAGTSLVMRNYGISSDQETTLLGPPITTQIGCTTDAACGTGQWCDENLNTCMGKLSNGSPLPTDPSHNNPVLSGTCTAAAAALVCTSGVCDTSNKCGYSSGYGPCTSGNGATVCDSGVCSVNGTCLPSSSPGACLVDGDCSGGQWCNEAINTCIAKLANGRALPSDPKHSNPTLNGFCTAAAASLVCVSSVCDTFTNACGYVVGDGPCTPSNGATVCNSGVCSVSGNCLPPNPGACLVDGDCTAGHWCDEAIDTCTAKLPNGTALPTDPQHNNPTLTGACTASAAALVCASGVCDTKDNECGYAKGDGACNSSNGGVVCRSGACSASGVCEPAGGCFVNGDCSSGQICGVSDTCLPVLTVTQWPTASAINFGQTLASSTLTGGSASVSGTFAWTSPSTVPPLGTSSQSVTFTPTDTTNYSPVTGSVQLTVNSVLTKLVVTTALDDAGNASNCTPQATAGTGTDASCSLRDALAFAAAESTGSISFSSTAFATPQTITLGPAGTLNVPSNTIVAGPTSGSGPTLANLVTISGANTYTVFTIDSGVTGSSISGLSITAGNNPQSGGGIVNDGTLTITNSTISGNQTAGIGGGVYNNGTLALTNTTISGNQSTDSGGGIYNQIGATLTLSNTTIANNTGGEFGGGLYNDGGLTAINSTIAANTASIAGGGAVFGSGAQTLANTLVSGNSAEVDADVAGSFTNNGGNITGGAANLSPLANYGGSTKTIVPLPGSAAICAGLVANIAGGITTDQRGYPDTNTAYPGYNGGTPCVDAGAVQTSYAISFTQQPPSSATGGVPLSPAPTVTLTENGSAFASATSSVRMTDADSALSPSGTNSAALSSGTATFNNLIFAQVESNDTLTASLSLNPNLTPALTLITTPSTGVNVAGETASLISPTQGTVLGSSDVQFQWTSGVGVSDYQLNLSVVAPGKSDLYLYKGTATSATAPTLPANGVTVFATLYSKINGVWQSNGYTYTESGTATPATLTSPTPGLSTVLGTSNVEFQWSSGTGVSDYQLNLSAVAPGQSELYSYKGTANSATAPTLPENGVTVYARLYSKINGVWQHNDFVYTESGIPTPAALTSPTPGLSTILGTSSVAFQWNAGIGASDYQLNLSAIAPGDSELYLYKGTALTTTAPNLPSNGATVYARLWSKINGTWVYNDYVYTEQ